MFLSSMLLRSQGASQGDARRLLSRAARHALRARSRARSRARNRTALFDDKAAVAEATARARAAGTET